MTVELLISLAVMSIGVTWLIVWCIACSYRSPKKIRQHQELIMLMVEYEIALNEQLREAIKSDTRSREL